MSDYGISAMYALLAGASLHAAWLTYLRPRVPVPALVRTVGYAALGVAFASLAIGRAGLFGLEHGGGQTWVTRGAFIAYGLTVIYIIALHWRAAWHHR